RFVAAHTVEPAAEPRHGRKRHKILEVGQLIAELLYHLLDQEIPEGNALQTFLAVGDRVEHSRRRLRGFDLVTIGRQQHLNVIRNVGGQGDLNEDQWLFAHLWMEEGEQAAILRLDPAAQIIPAVDLVNSLILDELFKNAGRR